MMTNKKPIKNMCSPEMQKRSRSGKSMSKVSKNNSFNVATIKMI